VFSREGHVTTSFAFAIRNLSEGAYSTRRHPA
jgi:hypothetical protein